MADSNLKTIIIKKIANINYPKYKLQDILKENDIWEEEWKKEDREFFINKLFENFNDKEIFDFVLAKEKKKERKRREELEEEFKNLAIDDESILLTFNLDELEKAISEFKSKDSLNDSNKESSSKSKSKAKKEDSLKVNLRKLGFMEMSITNMIDVCDEADLNEYARKLSNYRLNNDLESNSQAYKDKLYPTNPYVKSRFINDNYSILDIKLISEIFEAVNNGYDNIIVYDKEFNTPDNLISLAKLYNQGFILVNDEDNRKNYEDYKDVFNSLRDFSIVRGRSNFNCLSYKRDGLDKNCSEGKCIEDEFFDGNYDCIDDCPYKSQRDIAKIAKILITSYKFIYYIQKAYKLMYDNKQSRKKEFTKSKRLLIMDNPNLIEESDIKKSILKNGINRIFVSDSDIDLDSFGISKDKNYII